MEWSIQDIARLAGTTSRTLRHYGDVGLLEPSRVAANGYRYYDAAALARLQRILLLRELGLGLPAIADVLAGQTDDAHRRWSSTGAGCCRRRTVSTGRLHRSRSPSKKWKEVNNSWHRKCWTVSTTPPTDRR
jgi:DNA-binding transcriptional MerR regulator